MKMNITKKTLINAAVNCTCFLTAYTVTYLIKESKANKQKDIDRINMYKNTEKNNEDGKVKVRNII